MLTLWQRLVSRAQRTLAEDPQYYALALLTLALGLGVHAGLFESAGNLRLTTRPPAAADAMVIAANAAPTTSSIMTARPIPLAVISSSGTSDQAISAFVRRLAARHHHSRVTLSAQKHRRSHSARHVKVALRTHRRSTRRLVRTKWSNHYRVRRQVKTEWAVKPAASQPAEPPAIATWTETTPPAAEANVGMMMSPAAGAIGPAESGLAVTPAPTPMPEAAPEPAAPSPKPCPFLQRPNPK
jgi:hypothetical protein